MSNYDTKYVIFSEELVSGELGTYKAYGIRDITGEYRVSDVTSDYTEILKIVRLLNEYRVSKIHMMDVIYDLLE